MAALLAAGGHANLSRSSARITKLPEGAFHLRGQIAGPLAIPAQMRLVKGRAIEGGHEIATPGVAAVGLSLRQFFTQRRHPAAEGAQKAATQIGLFKHQPQHLLRLAAVFHLLPHYGEDCILQGRQGLTALWRLFKPLRHPLTEMFDAEGKQLFLGAEVAEKCAAGDPSIAADGLYRSLVEAYRGKQIPRGPFDLTKYELMFPFAKRPRILGFRPLFAARRKNRFLHCMQIMAQSAVL
jgi:hypothetical protein